MKKAVALFLVILISLLIIPCVASTAQAGWRENYKVRTDDGAYLGLKHYRPGTFAPFNTGAQPVIFNPGAAANFNEFDIYTPRDEEYQVKLPRDLPGWARHDRYIRRDHMKFYSLAYYLYDMGYDVWLTNYGRQGRFPNRSWRAWDATIDDYAIYDVKAVVKKVSELTGQKPIWIGHSMGSTMAYMYLQGAVYSWGWNPSVISDPAKVSERNDGEGSEALKGFVVLDGPIIPAQTFEVPGIAWWAFLPPVYLNFRPVTRNIGESAATPIMLIFKVLWAIRDYIPDPLDDYLALLYFINPDNIDLNVLKYLAEYALDGVHTHAMAQFTDANACGTLREYYRNGFLGRLRIIPPPVGDNDGLYHYSDNLDKISLPSLVLADATDGLTKPEDIEFFYQSKTRHELDEFHIMPGTAHVDLVCGLKAPYETFPLIGEWLDRLCED